MRYTYRYTILFFLLTSCFAVTAFGQNNTSPYSIIGIGDIESSYFDRSAGMADAGVSLFSGKFQYHANPASYSRLDDHFFSVEFCGRFKDVSYKGQPVASGVSNSADMQMEKMTMAIKVKPWWGASFGISPFSTSNYSFTAQKTIEGGSSQLLNASYSGTGGLHKAYLANSFKPFKNFSVGVEMSYLWGSLSQEEVLDASSITGTVLDTKRDYYLNKLYFKYGLLYNVKLSKKLGLSLGATASNKTKLSADYSVTVTEGNSVIVNDSVYKSGYFTLPQNYTVGGSLNYDNKFTLAVDYQAQNWNNLNYKGLGYSLVNSNRLSAGLEYSNKLNNIYERYYLQAGYYYGNTYLQINNNQLTDRGFTFGAGLNSKHSQLSYQRNLQLGTRGTTQSGLVKENYTQVSLSLIYRDFWRTKIKTYY